MPVLSTIPSLENLLIPHIIDTAALILKKIVREWIIDHIHKTVIEIRFTSCQDSLLAVSRLVNIVEYENVLLRVHELYCIL